MRLRPVFSILGGLAGVVACSSYDSAEGAPASGDDAGTRVDPPDAAREAGADGGAVDGSVNDGSTSCAVPAKRLDRAGINQTFHSAGSNADDVTVFGIAADAAHVYWLEQRRAKATSTDIYNGQGSSRLLRKPRTAKPLDAPVVLREDLGSVTQLVLLGTNLVFVSAETPQRLMSVAAACTPPCEPAVLGPIAAGTASDLTVTGPESLALTSLSGDVFVFEQGLVTKRGTTGGFPAVGYAGGVIYASSGETKDVLQAKPGSAITTFAALPPLDDPKLRGGVTQLAADCDWVYGFRADRWLWRSPIGRPAFTPWIDTASNGRFVDLFDLKADGELVYIASANAGGVLAIDRSTGQKLNLYEGNVWNVVVTDSAVIWGEHDFQANAGGSIYLREKK